MWIITAFLLSFNYPNIAGFMFGTLITLTFINYVFIKLPNYIADKIYPYAEPMLDKMCDVYNKKPEDKNGKV